MIRNEESMAKRIEREVLYLRHDFTTEERLEMGTNLAEAHNRLASIEEEETVMKAQVKDKKAGVTQTIGTLARNLGTGYEMRNTPCTLQWDAPNVGEVTYLDPDGRTVKTRAMTESERQLELPLEEKTDAQAELNLTDSQATADEFLGDQEKTAADQPEPIEPDSEYDPVLNDVVATDDPPAEDDIEEESAEDPLLTQAIDIVTARGKVSALVLQRELMVGYPKAAHLIDLMEAKGVVSEADPDGTRKVLKVAAAKPPMPRRAKSGPKDLAKFHAERETK